MKKKVRQWLEKAHHQWPLPIKSTARGAISGSVVGFIFSFSYSMLCGFPMMFVVFVMFLTEGLGGFFKGVVTVLWLGKELFVTCVLPSIAIGLVTGAITGLGVFMAKRTITKSTLLVSILNIVFWTPITFFFATRLLPDLMLPSWNQDPFELWLFIYIPSVIFVVAMVFVVIFSMNPFLKITENAPVEQPNAT